MQGDPTVIELLNEVLTGELTAVNQYFVHAKLCDNWGYKRLYDKVYSESIEEMKHADELIDRIIFLDGVPNVQRYGSIRIGETVPEQFELDLATEREAIERLRTGIVACWDKLDHVTRDLLEDILEDEEEHVDWLETQQETIRQVGLELYLSQQIRD
jgi:bacterioferritin